MKKLLFIALLTVGVAHAEDQIIGPFLGLNNTDNSATIPAGNAQDLLNVDLSLGGRSVLKREGYGLAYALTITTSPVHGTYDFFDASGNDVALAFNDNRMTSSINGGAISVLFSSGPNGATYQCTDSQGFAYCTNTTRNNIIKTNGVTYSMLPTVSTGTMICVTPDRLVQSGFAEAPNRIDVSAAADFTSWTTGISPTSAFSFTISAPGSRVTHICYAFNRIMWLKDSSFGYIIPGQTASDWVVQTISPNVGSRDNSSVYYQGILYFRGNDSHIWSYDGSNLQKMTRDIGATINASQSRASNSWTQTSQTDFQAGASTPSAYISTTVTPGSLVLDTATAVSPFSDTSASDFGSAASVTNLDTTTVSGSAILQLGSEFAVDQIYGSDNSSAETCGGSGSPKWYTVAFTASGEVMSSVVLRLYRIGSFGQSATVALASDSSNNPGTDIVSTTFDPDTLSTNSGSPTDLTVDLTNLPLTKNTTYWLRLYPPSNCVLGTKTIAWSFSATGSARFCNQGSCSSGAPPKYKVNGSTYPSSGSIVSRSFDVGFTTNTWLWNWNTFSASGTIPSGTTLTYETQTSSASVGGFDSLVSVSSGSSPTSTVKRFIRYKASFTTVDGSSSPVLTDIGIAMSNRIRPGATYYSAVKNAPNLTAWDTFGVTNLNNSGTQNFFIRSSTNPITVLSSTPSWASISAGAIPSISTGTYFQIADRFDVTNATQNPTLQDFTQNWFEGSASDKAYATYFKDAIWWSVASGAAATSNNTILRYDLLNNAWLKYDIPINGFYTRGTNLYFGSALTGNVFRYGSVDNDNGSAINAYWKSKDFFGVSPFNDEDVTSLSTFFASVANSSMTVTYTVNGSSSTSYTVPLYRVQSFGRDNRNLPLGTIGNTFNVQFGNNAADQPFEVFALQYGLTPKSWKPGQ